MVVRHNQVVATYEDGWDRLRAAKAELLPRVVNFITGPSRTADIELTLAIGVHGPQELYVIVNQGRQDQRSEVGGQRSEIGSTRSNGSATFLASDF